MMYRNIEKSVAHKGEYVGYANGVWCIVREMSQILAGQG